MSRPRGPARAVYGTLLAGALIVFEGAREQVDIPQLLLVVLVTQVVFWLAHVCGELVGHHIRKAAARVGPMSHICWGAVVALVASRNMTTKSMVFVEASARLPDTRIRTRINR